MILRFDDQDGDPVAVESERIIGLSVGDVTGPRAAGSQVRVTLIWTDGPQPFMVAAPFSAVFNRWIESRGQERLLKAYPDARGFEMQYPDGVTT